MEKIDPGVYVFLAALMIVAAFVTGYICGWTDAQESKRSAPAPSARNGSSNG